MALGQVFKTVKVLNLLCWCGQRQNEDFADCKETKVLPMMSNKIAGGDCSESPTPSVGLSDSLMIVIKMIEPLRAKLPPINHPRVMTNCISHLHNSLTL